MSIDTFIRSFPAEIFLDKNLKRGKQFLKNGLKIFSGFIKNNLFFKKNRKKPCRGRIIKNSITSRLKTESSTMESRNLK